MRLHHTFLILFLIIIQASAFGYELIMIQAISDSRKTFITRNGKRQGLTLGMTGTFTADDVSILARTIQVTGNFTQWEVINPELTLPFEKGTIVTYYPATEYLWATMPEFERRKFIKSQHPPARSSWVVKSAISRGLSESVSDAPADQPQRGGILFEVYYEKEIVYGFALDIGLRYEREIINYPENSFITNRGMVIADILYYFHALRDYVPGRFFVGMGLGWGISGTESTGLSQSGVVGLLPAAKAGITYPFNKTWEFLVDAAFESLQTKEQQEDNREQTTTQTNFKTGIGLKYYY